MNLREKIKNAPLEPGCYLFKDETGRVIYIGKAKVLKNRVKQYFMESNQKDEKGLLLAKKIIDVEFRITATERAALILEYQLIKEFRPWFNIQYKADRKTSYYIRLNRSGAYTSFEITSLQDERDKDCLGYFKSEGRAKEAILLLNQVFKTPVCSHKFLSTDKRQPCLHYQTNHCLGPCAGKVTPADYEKVIKQIEDFFSGKQTGVFRRLQKEFDVYLTQLEYEKAAKIRGIIDQLTELGGRIRHFTVMPPDQDMIVFFRAFRETGFSLFYIHNNIVIDQCDFTADLDLEKLTVFLRRSFGQQSQERFDTELTDCLRFVSADKIFLTLPQQKNIDKTIGKIIKQYQLYYK